VNAGDDNTHTLAFKEIKLQLRNGIKFVMIEEVIVVEHNFEAASSTK
jgi:hypothetical protein